MDSTLRIALMIAACLSPLLTFARLWQVKEWRFDRLTEHLNRTGMWRQLFGIVRPAIVVIAITGGLLSQQFTTAADGSLNVLAALTLVQMGLKRQPYPIWTKKTLILCSGALLLNLILISGGTVWLQTPSPWLHVTIVLLQPLVLATAWAGFYPIDRFMKERVFTRAEALRKEYPYLTVIGITGSVGKTTTKELLAHLLSDSPLLYTPAYVNSEMGVAQWLLSELVKYDPSEKLTLVVEMGAYKKGEIATLCRIAKPQLTILTYIGHQHVALFGSIEKLAQAKAEILASTPPDGHAFINGDNETVLSVQNQCPATVTVVGTGGQADLEAFEIEDIGNGIRFTVDNTSMTCPLNGTHNITNILLAVAVCQHMGMSTADIQSKLANFKPPSSTFHVKQENDCTILDDTHNASTMSFRAAIAWAKTQPMKPKTLITPGIIELGADAPRIHQELGESARGVFDRVIFTETEYSTAFAEGFSKPIEHWSGKNVPVAPQSLLACVGRVSQATWQKLLPRE